MARKVSPFAALTSEEKQIKWMEYQTIRLPYTQVGKEDWHHMQEKPMTEAVSNASTQQEATPYDPLPGDQPKETNSYTRPIPPPEVFVNAPGRQLAKTASASMQPSPAPSAYQQMNEYQKTRHRQYDAVIERMKQAERKTGSFCTW